MITSLKEMLELPTLATWPYPQYNLSHVVLRKSRAAIFADSIKNIATFIKAIFEETKKVKIIKNYVSKRNLYLYFLISENLLISGEKKVDVRRLPEVWHVIYTLFWSSLGKV